MIIEINGRLYGMNKANFIRRTKEFIEQEKYKIIVSDNLNKIES